MQTLLYPVADVLATSSVVSEFEKNGGCVCGSTRYALTAEPIASYICHCTDCQSRTGSAFGISTIVNTADLRITAGVTKTWKRTNRGATYAWERCSKCGTNLIATIEAAPGMGAIWPGTLDDQKWLKPKAQIWTRSAQDWVKLDESIATYDEQPENFADLFNL